MCDEVDLRIEISTSRSFFSRRTIEDTCISRALRRWMLNLELVRVWGYILRVWGYSSDHMSRFGASMNAHRYVSLLSCSHIHVCAYAYACGDSAMACRMYSMLIRD
jgi:hypothetical protein